MKKIDAITPIEGADRIETAHIGGWTCVVGKGEFSVGELVIYVEPDAFLPTSDSRWAQYAERGEKTMTIGDTPTLGHVLRTIRLRGQYSQGLVLKPRDVLPESIPEHAYQEMYENKARLDGLLNICEYHPDENSLAAGFIGKYDPFVAPRTDAERIQNISQETFDIIKKTSYFTSVKVDGTSITLVNDSRYGRIRAFSHNNEFSLEDGRGKLVIDTARKQGLLKFLEECPDTALQAELCGPKIGGNTLKLKDYRLFVFSIYDMAEREYVDPLYIDGYDSADAVFKSCVPYADDEHGQHFLDGFDSPQDLINWTTSLRDMVMKGCLDEGIVVHVMDCSMLSYDERLKLEIDLGQTMQMKSVSAAFLAKKKG
jgi:RNA ligase (TIGR02306 family)